jgi:hypothetical protein
MMNGQETTWHESNQRHLMAAVAGARAALEKFLGRAETAAGSHSLPAIDPPAALDTLCSTFGLSGFERKIVLLCAGAELDSHFAELLSETHKNSRHPLPTFSLALALFDDSHWSALSPARPLRYWRLVEPLDSDLLAASPLRLEERVLHYLAGVQCLDERVALLTRPAAPVEHVVPSHRVIAAEIAACWSRTRVPSALALIELSGSETSANRAVATMACSFVGVRLQILAASNIPPAPAEFERLVRLWEREAALSTTALLIEQNDQPGSDATVDRLIDRLAERIRSPLILSARVPLRITQRVPVRFEVAPPTPEEQNEIWSDALGAASTAVNGAVSSLVSQFSLGAAAIHSAARRALASGFGDQPADASDPREEPDGFRRRLWDACRLEARPQLEGLAQRIEPAATWDDLVLPEKQKQTLAEIAIHVRQRAKVYNTWGFETKGQRGLGISALFAGPSGTGKTMAGEVLASDLRLELHRIDLSQVVSKYIGETEKNLRRVFDAAEAGAAILLFDEADALFGKRSEVKDSHDRYANIEVSYLLQRMEAYRGLAILTTNRRNAIDQAFLRRIRFVVEFPFPDAAHRAEIWRRIFPRETPTEGLRIDRLARLNAAGGHIRNIALGAAFLAADAGGPVRMAHLLGAARSEFAKLERPLTDSEVAGWI